MGLSNIYDPVYYPQPSVLAYSPVLTQDSQFNSQIATDKIDITKYFTIFGGAIHSSIDEVAYSLPSGNLSTNLHQTNVTPMIALLLHPVPEFTTYFSYIAALQPGSMAPNTATNADQQLPPFLGKQWELGAKAELLPGLEAKVAWFRIAQAYAYLNSANTYVSDGTELNQGYEASLQGKVLPDLSLRTGFTALTARIKGGSQDGQDAAGVSPFRANIFAEYNLPMYRQVTLMGGAFYQSGFLVAQNPDANVARGYPLKVYAPGFTTFDLGAKYEVSLMGAPVTFRAYVSNIFNSHYWTSTNGGANVQIGQPITGKLTMSFKF